MVDGRELARTKAEERQQKLSGIRSKRRKRVLVAISAIFFVVLVITQVYNSSFFTIKTIDVSGNTYVSPAKIGELCAVDDSTNLLGAPINEIQGRLLKNPWIKSASVKRRLPSTLKVEIDERVPIALISHAGKFYLIDEDLCVIAERQYADNTEVPTITDLSIEKIKVGERLSSRSLENAVRCLKSMDPGFKKNISLLSCSSVDKLSLYNKDNIEILYGEAKKAEEKNKVLQSILKEQGKQVILIDIRSYPNSDPVIRRIDSAP